jgi:hypothetical protein
MKTCDICGVPVADSRRTCDDICRDAKRNRLTREQQIAREQAEPYPEPDGTGCKTCGARFCVCKEI